MQKALAKDPDGRFVTASKLAQALSHIRAVTGLELVSSGGQRIPLSMGGTSLGRDPDNDIVLREIEVSRYHARIYCEAATWLAMDLGSTNGTCLNEHQLKPHVAHPVASGDTLRLGYTTAFRVVATHTGPTADAKTTDVR